MRFFLAKALLLVSTTVLAAPASLAESEELGVYVTTDREWGNRETSGQWKVYTVAPHTCQDLGGTEFDKQISSFGPNPDIKCTVYQNYNCEGTKEPDDMLTIWHPGYALLVNFGWEDRISSFECSWWW